MKSGIELIAEERREQVTKHGRTIADDIKYNQAGQLSNAASSLCVEFDIEGENMREDIIALNEKHPPKDWNLKLWQKMIHKPYRERLIIAGALIAAELDRLNSEPNGAVSDTTEAE